MDQQEPMLLLVVEPSDWQVKIPGRVPETCFWACLRPLGFPGTSQEQSDFQEVSLTDNVVPVLGEAGVAWPPEYPTDVLLEMQNSQKDAGLGSDLFFYQGHENDGEKSRLSDR
jgi:hypothetical protein